MKTVLVSFPGVFHLLMTMKESGRSSFGHSWQIFGGLQHDHKNCCTIQSVISALWSTFNSVIEQEDPGETSDWWLRLDPLLQGSAARKETAVWGETDGDIYGLLNLHLGLASSCNWSFSFCQISEFRRSFVSFNVALPQPAVGYIRYYLLLLLSSPYPEGQVALWVQSHSDGLLHTAAPPHNRLSFAWRNQHGLFGLLSRACSCQSEDQPVHWDFPHLLGA